MEDFQNDGEVDAVAPGDCGVKQGGWPCGYVCTQEHVVRCLNKLPERSIAND